LVAALLAVALAAAGVVGRDRALTRAVARRRDRARAEFPTVVDMVCVAVTAGESLRGALELVARDGAGPLASELRVALRAARGGLPLATALGQAAQRLGLPVFDRFVGAVVAAQERGISLAEALRAMAFDVREAEKREVIEAAGRKQVSMLVPVVGLILPVAIVFAFYPGVVAIKTLARGERATERSERERRRHARAARRRAGIDPRVGHVARDGHRDRDVPVGDRAARSRRDREQCARQAPRLSAHARRAPSSSSSSGSRSSW
jgi:pilus assembly protein TadC